MVDESNTRLMRDYVLEISHVEGEGKWEVTNPNPISKQCQVNVSIIYVKQIGLHIIKFTLRASFPLEPSSGVYKETQYTKDETVNSSKFSMKMNIQFGTKCMWLEMLSNQM